VAEQAGAHLGGTGSIACTNIFDGDLGEGGGIAREGGGRAMQVGHLLTLIVTRFTCGFTKTKVQTLTIGTLQMTIRLGLDFEYAGRENSAHRALFIEVLGLLALQVQKYKY
jgi:hypothetical protein